MKLLSYVHKEFVRQKDSTFFIISLFVFALLRIPSLVEPYWYGDEGIYGVMGRAIDSGRILYKGIWDNKPPLLYYTYAVFHSDLFWVKAASFLFGLGALITLYKLSKVLFKSSLAVQISTILFAVLFGLPLLEGNIANAENFMLFPILLAVYLVVTAKKPVKTAYIFAGLLLSLAFLYKIVAVFDIAAIGVMILIRRFDESIELSRQNKRFHITPHIKHIVSLLEDEIALGVAFFVPILLTVLYFFFHQALGDFFRATFSQNVGYVGYGNQFIIPQGLLILKLLILAAALFVVFRFRKPFGFAGVVIFVWFAFSFFNAFFSERPYTHYLLVLLPSFCLMTGYIFEKTRIRFLAAAVIVVGLFVILKNFGLYKAVLPYYENYVQYVFMGKSVDAYQGFFDKNTPRDYEVARFIESHTTASDTVFLWSDSAQIYVLADKLPPGRYIVAYHMTWFAGAMAETKQDLQRTNPKYIIDTKHTEELGPLLAGYQLQYKISSADIYERQL